MIAFLRSLSTPTVAGIHRRLFSRFNTTRTLSTGSSSSQNTSKHQNADHPLSYIPEPTWSIKSLELDFKHAKLPPDQVQRLAHLALLDLDQLLLPNSKNDLEQDLGNMMHMVEQVSDFVKDPSNKELFTIPQVDDAFQYDYVRGVTSAPYRSVQAPPDAQDLEDAARVWGTYLEPSTTLQGGSHQYFSISTKEIV